MDDSSLNRREFMELAGVGTLLLAAPGVVSSSVADDSENAAAPRLKGFIVSDAHFGFRDRVQPTPEESRQAMANIMARFPDLDVFVDTGDIHHADAADKDRGNWTDIVAGGCGTLPLFYCMGNHEFGGQEDTEARSCRLGSLSCRPYQSWSLKGIHFVVAPELISPSYVSRELLDWLELDLSVHHHMTTILFSHNSLKGTTYPLYDLGYRLVSNSSEMFELLRRHPQVIAWMHGHNHNWDAVKKDNRLFVSNGRIGGFDPGGPGESGKGHLGGIYFAIDAEGLTVRGYSSTRGAFFDEFDRKSQFLHQRLECPTTLNPRDSAAVCYGMGDARHGQRVPIYHHHSAATGGQSEVFLTGVGSSTFNEDPNLCWFSQRIDYDGRKMDAEVHGVKIGPKPASPKYHDAGQYPDPTWEWMNPGLRLLALADPSQRRTLQLPGARWGKFQYYRCAPGARLRVQIDAHAMAEGPRLQLTCHVFDSSGAKHATLTAPWWDPPTATWWNPPAGEEGRYQHDFQLPELTEIASIYSNAASDTQIQVYIEVAVADLKADVFVRHIEVGFADATGPTSDAALDVNGRKAEAPGKFAAVNAPCAVWAEAMAARSVVAITAGGSRLATWLIRETGLQWQVRNAPCAMSGGWLEIGKLRNCFSPRQEIVIVPLAGKPPLFVHRLRKVNGARILAAAEGRAAVSIEIQELLGPAPAEVEFVVAAKPHRVEGADRWSFADGRVVVSKSSPGVIRVEM